MKTSWDYQNLHTQRMHICELFGEWISCFPADLLLLQQGMIQTPQELFMIHPLPDRLGLEKNRTRAHVIHRRSVTPLQALRKAMREENRPDEWCGVEGTAFENWFVKICSDQMYVLQNYSSVSDSFFYQFSLTSLGTRIGLDLL